MRKLFLSIACMMFMAGIVIAAEHTIVSYKEEGKVLVLKGDDDKEVKAKITDKTKFYMLVKDEKKEGKWENVEKMLKSEKAVGSKIMVEIKDGEVTELTTKRGGKKKN